MKTVLSLVDVTFEHKNDKLFDGLTFKIKSGEIVSLLGPSGSGKSTMIRLFLGFAAPNKGDVNVGGRIVSSNGRVLVPPEERNLAVVFQDLALWPHLSVQGNLDFGLKAKRIEKPEREQQIFEMLARLGLQGKAHRYPDQLSGGEKQRVAIARALSLDPSAILLDEPLSNLDAALKRELMTVFRELFKEHDVTALYVTHDLREAAALGDRIVVIESGRLVQEGTLADLRRTQATAFVKDLLEDLDWGRTVGD
ncbi:MAG: ABC transporter ATP-binding protein [Proteobacteria bacterium]|nr:ABC transporter ATP-binding protein [Pseudomonadota bacterium]